MTTATIICYLLLELIGPHPARAIGMMMSEPACLAAAQLEQQLHPERDYLCQPRRTS